MNVESNFTRRGEESCDKKKLERMKVRKKRNPRGAALYEIRIQEFDTSDNLLTNVMLVLWIIVFQLLQQGDFCSGLQKERLLAFDDFDSHLFISVHIYSLDNLTKRSFPYPFDQLVPIINNLVRIKDVVVIVIIPAVVL